jgi:hypothetical protein
MFGDVCTVNMQEIAVVKWAGLWTQPAQTQVGCRKIAISLINPENGEQTAQACDIAWFTRVVPM